MTLPARIASACALPACALPACALLACVLLAACSGSEGPRARLAGVLLDPGLNEASGLAASRAHRDTLWLVEDGGNPAQLHAVGKRGRRRASLVLDGVPNTDWEDLAAFELQGRRYLLVADTGDNGGLRRTLQLHVVEEPAELRDGARVRPAWSIAFRWPDGPRDCEAVAVDAARGTILLLSKKRRPPELFALPLQPGNADVQVARLLGRARGMPPTPATPSRRDPARERLQAQVSAADLSPDGTRLAVLTYGQLLLFTRRAGDTWAQALARRPSAHPLPLLHQPEAVAWAADGQGVYATSEFSPAPLVYLPAPP